jgi:N-glycosylase/DNA lyase
MNSRVYPTYKTKYRVANWASYDRALVGRRRWKKASRYHRQARVENAFFRYKSIIGKSLHARSLAGQGTEAVLACHMLNQMTHRGRPASYAIGR